MLTAVQYKQSQFSRRQKDRWGKRDPKRAKQSQFPAVPGGTGLGGRGPWNVVQTKPMDGEGPGCRTNKANLPRDRVSGISKPTPTPGPWNAGGGRLYKQTQFSAGAGRGPANGGRRVLYKQSQSRRVWRPPGWASAVQTKPIYDRLSLRKEDTHAAKRLTRQIPSSGGTTKGLR